MGIKHAKFIDFENRQTPIDKKYHDIYLNGADNFYPSEMELAMFASPTALKAHRIKTKFIAGRGLKLNGEKIKYRDQPSLNLKGHNIFDIVENSAQSTSGQRGVFLWVGYGIEGDKIKPKYYEVLDFSMCRITKEDDLENAGKIYYGDFHSKEKVDKWFYPFNDREDVVHAQIQRDFDDSKKKSKVNENKEWNLIEAIKGYRGQVFFLNLDKNLVYPTSAIHAVVKECEGEYELSKYFHGNIKNGFLGKKAIITQGLSDEVSKMIEKDLKEWLGPKGSEGVYSLDVEQAENLDNVLKIIDIPTSFNEKQFEQTLKTFKNNIMGAFNVLSVLVDTSDGSLFGTSGEAYEAAKIIQDDLTESYRNAVENMLFKVGLNIEIIPLTALDEATIENDKEVIEDVVEQVAEENQTTENNIKKEPLINRLKKILWS